MTIDLSRTAPSTWTIIVSRVGQPRATYTFSNRADAERAYSAIRAI